MEFALKGGHWQAADLFNRFFNRKDKKAGEKEKSLTLRDRQRSLMNQYRKTGSFLTSPPRGYQAPSDRELKKALQRANIGGAISLGFVRDLCNMAFGGKLNPSSIWMPIVDSQLKRLTAAERRTERNKTIDRLNGISSFLRSIDFRNIPGNSPVDKSISILKLLLRDTQNDLSGSSSGFSLPILTQATTNNFNRDVESVFSDYAVLDDDDFALLMADKSDKGEGTSVDKQREVLEELLTDPLKSQMAKIARTLGALDKLSIVPVWENTPDRNGEEVNRRQLETLEELTRIDKQQWAIFLRAPELFWQRVMTRELSVRERVKRSTKRQLLYVLIDCSGSMGDHNKKRIGTACGVLMNRLKAVMRGEAELYYRFFDESVYEENKVSTKEEAISAMRRVMKNNYSGGSTSIDGALRTAIDRIEEISKNGDLIKPQIAIVTDGEDSISIDKRNLKDSVLHAVLCITDNSKLRGLAERSGGIGIRIED